MTTVAAVDLGASSGRVFVGRFLDGAGVLEEVHRFPNVPVRSDGVLRWDIRALYREVLDGLDKADKLAGPLDAVGVDSWALDYGLIDEDGKLLESPVHYRQDDTGDAIAFVRERLGLGALYQATGIQHLPFNTVFQLLARSSGGTPLLIPDLINFWLCGSLGTEITNASTTGLIDARTRDWAGSVFAALDLPNRLAPLHSPGTVLGPVSPILGLRGAPVVVAAPSHDTAAAVLGVPATCDRFAYVCTGTWSLVGLELPAPIITDASRTANFTNEFGVDGTVRFLRNVTGFWLLQECLREWGEPDLDVLLREATNLEPRRALIDVQDPEFAEPDNMPARIIAAASSPLTSRAEIVRCILDSMAVAVRDAIDDAIGYLLVRSTSSISSAVVLPMRCSASWLPTPATIR